MNSTSARTATASHNGPAQGHQAHPAARIAWASQARHLSLYVLRADVVRTHRESLAGLDVGKGCIRYRRPEQVDLQVVRRMLADTAATRGPVC